MALNAAPEEEKADNDAGARMFRWSTRFRDPKLERAFGNFHRSVFGTGARTAAAAAGIVLLCVASALYLGLSRRGDTASVFFVACAAVCCAALCALSAVRLATGAASLRLTEAAFVLCGLCFAAATVLQAWAVPRNHHTSSSSSSDGSGMSGSSSQHGLTSSSAIAIKTKTVLPSLYTAMLRLPITFAFLFFSPLHFPRVVRPWLVVALASICSYVAVLFTGNFNILFAAGMILSGDVIMLSAAWFTSKDRRRDFLATVLRQRELGVVTAEKASVESLVSALFPHEIVARLKSTRILANAGVFLGSSSNGSINGSNGGSEGSTHAPSLASSTTVMSTAVPMHHARHGGIVADAFSGATVVFATVCGLEHFQPFDVQLKVLADVFIAADHIAEAHGAVKVKSVGSSLLFACGVPRPSEQHRLEACRLVADLLAMIAAFRKQLGTDALALQAGIATGPVVAGVIGMTRPKYDVWGYTVSVAEKLAQVAAPGAVLVTRDIAMNEKGGGFRFRKLARTTIVPGLGKVLLFQLEAPQSSTPVVLNCTPVNFEMSRDVHTELHEVAKTLREHRPPKLRPCLLWFRKKADELAFMRTYTEKFINHLRVFGCLLFIVNLAYQVQAIAQGLYFNIFRWAGNLTMLGAELLLLVVPHVRPVVRRPVLLWMIASLLAVVISGMDIALWVTGAWSDGTLVGMLAIFFLLTASRIPFWVICTLDLATYLGTLSLYTTLGYTGESAIFSLAILLAILAAHWEQERQARKVWHVNAALEETKLAASNERKIARQLLESAVPSAVIDKLAVSHTRDSFISQVVPSGTVLVCNIVDFDEMYKRLKPEDAVRLLNALFSHFDSLAMSHGLEPLKTIGDEYIVVGNVLGTTPDEHASRVVALAVDMITTIGTFNSTFNPTSVHIAIRIGIHTDALLTGMIRMKAFSFDCWGNGVPVAEELCMAAANNAILISKATRDQAGGAYSTIQVGTLDLGGGFQVPAFSVVNAVAAPMATGVASMATARTGSMQFSMAPTEMAVDYGVFQDSPTGSAAALSAMQEVEDDGGVRFVPFEGPIEQDDSEVQFVPATAEDEALETSLGSPLTSFATPPVSTAAVVNFGVPPPPPDSVDGEDGESVQIVTI